MALAMVLTLEPPDLSDLGDSDEEVDTETSVILKPTV